MMGKWSKGADHEFPAAGKCHDCGMPCRDYRCPGCRARFVKKNRLSFDESDPESKYSFNLSYIHGWRMKHGVLL